MQTPQRFRMELTNDPLGNHAISQYDVINHGKDGIGAVSSSGQGSLWRVEALKGQQPDGKVVEDPKDLSLVGKKLGFRSEMLIEDTHTSIELFRQVGRLHCGIASGSRTNDGYCLPPVAGVIVSFVYPLTRR